jgi:hypothetical protein
MLPLGQIEAKMTLRYVVDCKDQHVLHLPEGVINVPLSNVFPGLKSVDVESRTLP